MNRACALLEVALERTRGHVLSFPSILLILPLYEPLMWLRRVPFVRLLCGFSCSGRCFSLICCNIDANTALVCCYTMLREDTASLMSCHHRTFYHINFSLHVLPKVTLSVSLSVASSALFGSSSPSATFSSSYLALLHLVGLLLLHTATSF